MVGGGGGEGRGRDGQGSLCSTPAVCWARCFCRHSSCTSLYTQRGSPMQQRMEERKYFLSPAVISFHDTGLDSPPPPRLPLARRENPTYTPGITGQKKTLKPVTRLTRRLQVPGVASRVSLLDIPLREHPSPFSTQAGTPRCLLLVILLCPGPTRHHPGC